MTEGEDRPMRGKHKAKAARRDADASQAELEQLQQRFDEHRTATTQELRELRTDKQRLHDQLLGKVEALAADRVEQAQQRHAQDLAALRQAHYDLLVSVVDTLWRDTSMSAETLHEVLALTNVKMGDVPTVAAQPNTDRGDRRVPSREAARVSLHNIKHPNQALLGRRGPVIGQVKPIGYQKPDSDLIVAATTCEEPPDKLST